MGTRQGIKAGQERPNPSGGGLSRRGFIGGAASVAASITIVPRYVLGGAVEPPPSERLNIAGVGFGGIGAHNLKACADHGANIVALCDVDHTYAAPVFATYPQAATYHDYRVMFDKQKDIDAVVIATPDHSHAVIAMAAMQLGKHVFVQKPMAHDVVEVQALKETARRMGVAAQMGIQGHSGEGARLVCEWIWDGAIGAVREVEAWCSLSYYPPGPTPAWTPASLTRPPDEPPTPLPEGLDWDLWIGPAPYRPYSPLYHPGCWRAWWDFGTSMLADRGTHTLDPVFWALDLGAPTSVEATSTGLNEETYPVSSVVRYEFPARGDLPPVRLTWYDGLRPFRPDALEAGRQFGHVEGGALFVGNKGNLVSGVCGESPRLIPESAMQAYQRPPKTIPRCEGGVHELDWLKACKSGKQPGANFDFSAPLTEAILLGNIAKRMDTKLYWDAGNRRFTNNDDANQYLHQEYRPGWSLY